MRECEGVKTRGWRAPRNSHGGRRHRQDRNGGGEREAEGRMASMMEDGRRTEMNEERGSIDLHIGLASTSQDGWSRIRGLRAARARRQHRSVGRRKDGRRRAMGASRRALREKSRARAKGEGGEESATEIEEASADTGSTRPLRPTRPAPRRSRMYFCHPLWSGKLSRSRNGSAVCSAFSVDDHIPRHIIRGFAQVICGRIRSPREMHPFQVDLVAESSAGRRALVGKGVGR
ncbi:hypothetical protein FB451DRAFT_1300396, partial [Mycena latifolia]